MQGTPIPYTRLQLAVAANGQTDITGTTTWVVPAGVSLIFIDAASGGGGGGGGNTSATGGGGGGGASGLMPILVAMRVIPGETLTITPGAGGLAGNVNGNGGPGGLTSIVGGTSLAQFKLAGGSGGIAGAATNGGSGGVAPSSLLAGGVGGAGAGPTGGFSSRNQNRVPGGFSCAAGAAIPFRTQL